MTLTKEEKVKRFDSLMLVIPMKIEEYEKLADEYEKRINDQNNMKALEILDYGKAVAFRKAADDMRRWI